MIQVVLGIAVFTGVVLLLVCVILAARARLSLDTAMTLPNLPAHPHPRCLAKAR